MKRAASRSAEVKRKASSTLSSARASPSSKRVKRDDSTSAGSATTPGGPPVKTLKEFVRSPEAVALLNTKRTDKDIWGNVKPFVRQSKDADFKPASMWKFITWNVAGLRGILRKDDKVLCTLMEREQPDILCLQETKLNPAETKENTLLGAVPNYVFMDHLSHTKKGYSGTRVYLHEKRVLQGLQACTTRGFSLPSDVRKMNCKGEDVKEFEVARCGKDKTYWPADMEGRVQTVWMTLPAISGAPSSGSSSRSSTPPPPSSGTAPLLPGLALINTYVPNSGMTLDRLPYRVENFDPAMRSFLKDAQSLCRRNAAKQMPATADRPREGSGRRSRSPSPPATPPTELSLPCGIIWTGDLNVAERDFDRYYAGTYRKMQECSGFTPEERFSFRETMDSLGGATDAFRHLYPDAGPTYTFWSARIKGREKGMGWRLDYFVVSKELVPFVVDVFPMPQQQASDHCPVQMWLRRKLKA